MAMLTERARADLDAAQTELWLQLERVDRGVKASYGAAKAMLLTALATFPIVVAYHIDFSAELKLEIDLGSVMWTALLPGALASGLNGLRLSRIRRRIVAALESLPPH